MSSEIQIQLMALGKTYPEFWINETKYDGEMTCRDAVDVIHDRDARIAELEKDLNDLRKFDRSVLKELDKWMGRAEAWKRRWERLNAMVSCEKEAQNETLEDANDLISTADRDMGIDWYRAAKGMIRRLVQWNQEKDDHIAELEGTIMRGGAALDETHARIARLESLVRGLSTDCKCSDACEDGDCDYCMARSNAKEAPREQ